MIRTFRHRAPHVSLFGLLALLALATTPARGQVQRPFSIKGEGLAPQGLPLPGQAPRPHSSAGAATDLGAYTGLGTVETDTATFEPNGTITGQFGSGSPYVFVGANGDRLVCEYGRTEFGASEPGTFELTILAVLPDGSLLVEAAFVAQFIPQPAQCTGRFKGVTGGWLMFAFSGPFVLGSTDPTPYYWYGHGALTYHK